ncbi:MAG: SRPBCC family protein [Alphaproteobacteria bacterium]|nr:SRPBCC family protein [Alphaproteobacteria bacterium]
MPNVTLSTPLPVSAKQVWDMIGSFNALPNWHPIVECSEVEEDKTNRTTIRKLHLLGGGTVVEKLTEMDDDEKVYSYEILESPLPVKGYKATIRVREDGNGSEVEWSSDFEAEGASNDDAVKIIQGIYDVGFENLRKIFGG